MKSIAMLAAVCAGLCLVACGGSTETYAYPSESMEPTISYQEEVTADLDAYDHAVPVRGDIVVFHPPAGIDMSVSCGVQSPPSQPCPKPTSGLSSEVFIKRIVAVPGDRISIRDGQPVVNGRAVLTKVIQKCSGNACNLPKPTTIRPGQYFIMGDNSRASNDSRYWGPIPRAAILGKVEG